MTGCEVDLRGSLDKDLPSGDVARIGRMVSMIEDKKTSDEDVISGYYFYKNRHMDKLLGGEYAHSDYLKREAFRICAMKRGVKLDG